jgi:hypothetical protein
MHRLEITGNTPEELYFNCIKTLSIMLKGAGSTATPVNEPVQDAPSATEEDQRIVEVQRNPADGADKSVEQEIIPPAPKKRGPKPKAKTEELNDDVPDLGGAPAETKKELTLDGDIKPRLQAISAACTKRGLSMPETVAYIKRLYGPFGIAKAPQLKPEQFAEFMEASEAYLDGTAEA